MLFRNTHRRFISISIHVLTAIRQWHNSRLNLPLDSVAIQHSNHSDWNDWDVKLNLLLLLLLLLLLPFHAIKDSRWSLTLITPIGRWWRWCRPDCAAAEIPSSSSSSSSSPLATTDETETGEADAFLCQGRRQTSKKYPTKTIPLRAVSTIIMAEYYRFPLESDNGIIQVISCWWLAPILALIIAISSVSPDEAIQPPLAR